MLTVIRANNIIANMKVDVGQYNLLTKKLQLWVNSSRLMNGLTDIVVPAFTMPEDIAKLEIVDEGTDQTLDVPVNTFKETVQEDGTYKFTFSEWLKKYKRLF